MKFDFCLVCINKVGCPPETMMERMMTYDCKSYRSFSFPVLEDAKQSGEAHMKWHASMQGLTDVYTGVCRSFKIKKEEK